jgi:polysaccharide biosynthesis/export protein
VEISLKTFLWLGFVMAALVTTACSSNGKNTMPPTSAGEKLVEYRIGVGDALQVNVWRNPELSLAVPVRPDGKISIPLVGDVMAANLTTAQLSDSIAAGLEKYVRSPQVTVIVTNPSSADFQRRVRITGAVHNPQSLPYREGMTVLDLFLLAGGSNDFAAANKAKLYRKVNGETKAYPVRFDDLVEEGKLETNYPLQPSDIITVPERAF